MLNSKIFVEMRKTLFIMVAMFISLNVAVIAEEPAKDVNYETILQKTENGKIPRTIIPETIECCYSGGVLYFNSDVEMSNIYVVVTRQDDNTSYTYFLNSSYDNINTQLMTGDYNIVVYGDLSNYEGLLTIY
jgi:hypothetical protein